MSEGECLERNVRILLPPQPFISTCLQPLFYLLVMVQFRPLKMSSIYIRIGLPCALVLPPPIGTRGINQSGYALWLSGN